MFDSRFDTSCLKLMEIFVNVEPWVKIRTMLLLDKSHEAEEVIRIRKYPIQYPLQDSRNSAKMDVRLAMGHVVSDWKFPYS